MRSREEGIQYASTENKEEVNKDKIQQKDKGKKLPNQGRMRLDQTKATCKQERTKIISRHKKTNIKRYKQTFPSTCKPAKRKMTKDRWKRKKRRRDFLHQPRNKVTEAKKPSDEEK